MSLPSKSRPLLRQCSDVICKRSFSASYQRNASVLFALSGLSNSRETQHFNKITRLNRIEHSPSLKLIKSSEVDPFPLPTPPRSSPPRMTGSFGTGRLATEVWDDRALKLGRAMLVDHALRVKRLKRALHRAKRMEALRGAKRKREELVWAHEANQLRSELRTAGILIFCAIATATVLAMTRFWPQRDSRHGAATSNEQMATGSRGAMPIFAETKIESPLSLPTQQGERILQASLSQRTKESVPPEPGPVMTCDATTSWKRWFWKQ